MRKVNLLVMLAIGQLLMKSNAYAQGCSDAGFCSIGSFKPEVSKDSTAKHLLSIGTAIGQGDDAVLVVTPYLQYDLRISKRWSIQSKITGNLATGNLGEAAGLGDVFVTGTYTVPLGKKWNIQYTAGAKIPLNSGNLSIDGKPLPMQYQSSLGTLDAIAGVTVSNKHWQFSGAVQLPIDSENKNGFLPVYWGVQESAMNYPSTNAFARKPDVLLRVSNNILRSQHWNVAVGLLGIYHLGNDTYINPFINNNRIAIEGSKGLTLNGTATATFKVSNKWQLGVTAGVPLAIRDIRPDGLTRSWVISPECRFSF